jgi:hypothetical protein
MTSRQHRYVAFAALLAIITATCSAQIREPSKSQSQEWSASSTTTCAEDESDFICQFIQQRQRDAVRMYDGISKCALVVSESTNFSHSMFVFRQRQGGLDLVNPDSVGWTGGCKDGLADGPGKATWFLKGVFAFSEEGYFESGLWKETGKLILADGSVYEGRFDDDRKFGKLTMPDGGIFEGEFTRRLAPLNGIATLAQPDATGIKTLLYFEGEARPAKTGEIPNYSWNRLY